MACNNLLCLIRDTNKLRQFSEVGSLLVVLSIVQCQELVRCLVLFFGLVFVILQLSLCVLVVILDVAHVLGLNRVHVERPLATGLHQVGLV